MIENKIAQETHFVQTTGVEAVLTGFARLVREGAVCYTDDTDEDNIKRG